MKTIRSLFLAAITLLLVSACKTHKTAVETAGTQQQTEQEEQLQPLPGQLSALYSGDELHGWQLKDPLDDKLSGMSVEKAYATILKKYPGDTVIVAVLDSGMDIDHEDLKDKIWTNKDEIPGNGIDDDHNGYVDDVHGWNFLGNRDGRKAYAEQLELTRLVAKYRPLWKDKTIDQIPEKDRATFELYQRAEKKLAEKLKEAKGMERQVKMVEAMVAQVEQTLKDFLKADTLTEDKVKAIETDDPQIQEAKEKYLSGLNSHNKRLERFRKYVEGQLKYNLNIDFNGRAVVGDNPDDWNDRDYGNPDVRPVDADESHATHVAGIIAAKRHNGIGMDGVADKVLIMPIRAVPDGDEYDKDIALGIRYAVDNGAKIINMSFGKYFSPHKEWVWDAIKYAQEHDVLLVNAAGNDAKDMDKYGENMSYPNDGDQPGQEIADNFITIGAYGPFFGADLPAPFSNYGKTTVDVFSPGVKIWSTVPFNDYASYNGTSMAAPDAAGVAALIRSRFPQLTAAQVKKILMESGITPEILVFVPDEESKVPPVKKFSELCKSGKIINAYNALLMAEKMAKEQAEEKKDN